MQVGVLLKATLVPQQSETPPGGGPVRVEVAAGAALMAVSRPQSSHPVCPLVPSVGSLASGKVE